MFPLCMADKMPGLLHFGNILQYSKTNAHRILHFINTDFPVYIQIWASLQVWVCTVCSLPTKRTLGLYGLSDRQTTAKHLEKVLLPSKIAIIESKAEGSDKQNF